LAPAANKTIHIPAQIFLFDQQIILERLLHAADVRTIMFTKNSSAGVTGCFAISAEGSMTRARSGLPKNSFQTSQ
jgi:hypothetical protein